MESRMLYFLPGREAAELEPANRAGTLQAVGLADRFDGIDLQAAKVVANGPDGGAGVLASDPPLAGILYKPDEQAWFDAGSYWFGWWNEGKPGPAALGRRNMLHGRDVWLADALWTVPVAELQPKVRDVDAAGAWSLNRDPKHDDLFRWADELLQKHWEPIDAARIEFEAAVEDARQAGENASEKQMERFEAAKRELGRLRLELDPAITCRILALNYRLGPREIAKLGLLVVDPHAETGADWWVLDAFVDGPGIRAARAGKKN